MQTSVYVVFILMYIVADFAPMFITNPSTSWYACGEAYLSMITYMMAGCVLCVNVITTSISKIGPSKVYISSCLIQRKLLKRHLYKNFRSFLTFLSINFYSYFFYLKSSSFYSLYSLYYYFSILINILLLSILIAIASRA